MISPNNMKAGLKKMINTIFMDIDDTIFDFNQCSYDALFETCALLNITFSEETYRLFRFLDAALWQEQKKGELTVEDVMSLRAGRFAEQTGTPELAGEFQLTFRQALSSQTALVPDAEKLIRSLSPCFPLYAASNGIKDVQISRLKNAGLFPFFAGIFVSDDIGFEKPDIRFFKVCLSRIRRKPDEVLMIGDSLRADIAGAAAGGLKTCWFNPKKQANSSAIIPDYEISGLLEFLTLK